MKRSIIICVTLYLSFLKSSFAEDNATPVTVVNGNLLISKHYDLFRKEQFMFSIQNGFGVESRPILSYQVTQKNEVFTNSKFSQRLFCTELNNLRY